MAEKIIGHGIGWIDFCYYSNGEIKPVSMFKRKLGNTHEAMEELRKRIDKIGNNRMFVNVALWTMVYGFAIRLLMGV